MEKKTALIIMYIGTAVPYFGLLGFLIALLAGKKEVVGGRNLTQGLILMLVQCLGTALIVGPLVSLVFSIFVRFLKDLLPRTDFTFLFYCEDFTHDYRNIRKISLYICVCIKSALRGSPTEQSETTVAKRCGLFNQKKSVSHV